MRPPVSLGLLLWMPRHVFKCSVSVRLRVYVSLFAYANNSSLIWGSLSVLRLNVLKKEQTGFCPFKDLL